MLMETKKLKQSKITPIKWYVDHDERVLRSSEVNEHHVLYPKNVWKYGTPTQKKLRTMGGFVQRMSIPIHKDLHSAVEIPPLTNPHLMEDILRVQKGYQNLDPMTRLTLTIARLGEIATGPNDQVNEQAYLMIDNLNRQKEIVILGSVRLLEE